MTSTAKILLLLAALGLALVLAMRLKRGLEVLGAEPPARPAVTSAERGDWVELAPMPDSPPAPTR